MPLIHFDNQPLWQIAMVLQATQAQRLGLRPDYGIDYQLLQAAREMSLPVQELEGRNTSSNYSAICPMAGWRCSTTR